MRTLINYIVGADAKQTVVDGGRGTAGLVRAACIFVGAIQIFRHGQQRDSDLVKGN